MVNVLSPDLNLSLASGYYAQLDTSSSRRGDTGRLVSPPFESEVDLCLVMGYRLTGSDVGTLRVLRQERGSSGEALMWDRSGEWQSAPAVVMPHNMLFLGSPHKMASRRTSVIGPVLTLILLITTLPIKSLLLVMK